jgi:outer membrane receptor protein involved in Fe transport
MIRKKNEIGSVSIQEILNNPDLFASRAVRGPNLPSDEVGWLGPVTSIDASLANFAKSKVRALDFGLDFADLHLGKADLHIYGSATRQLDLLRQVAVNAPLYQFVDFSGGVLKWRGNLGADLKFGRIRGGWAAQYYSGYSARNSIDPDSLLNDSLVILQGRERIHAQVYNDIYVKCQLPLRGGLVPGLELSASVQNVFNKRPPALAAISRGYSSYGDPRLRRFVLSVSSHF